MPIGFTVERSVIEDTVITMRVIDPEHEPTVRRMFDLAGRGTTPGEISRTFNAEGVKTRRGKPWSTRGVRGVIENPDYLGQNGYPQLIAAATWERAQPPKRPSERAHRVSRTSTSCWAGSPFATCAERPCDPAAAG
jgi:hypothetical protein